MKKLSILLLLFFISSEGVFSASFYRITGGGAVRKHLVKNNALVSWLVIHDDENDALQVMKWAFSLYGGAGLEVLNLNRPNKRVLKEYLAKQSFFYDPNRIFTDTGIHKTLLHYNRNYKKIHRLGFQYLKYQARKGFLNVLPLKRTSYLVALHNNDKRSSISVLNYYKKKGFYIFRNPKEHIKNFVIVTRRKDFETLMKNGINVVWQYEVNSENNDGSLSIYCYQKQYPYINIESVYGDIEAQKKIVKCVVEQIIQKIHLL